MLRADAKTEALRRGGLFVGAVMLASWCTRGFYYLAGCRGAWRTGQYPGAEWLIFMAIGVWLMIVLHDRFLRSAAVAFVAQSLIAASPVVASDLGARFTLR